MLSLYRRHGVRCTAKRPKGDRAFWRCRCTVYVQGTLAGEHVRESLKTASRESAQRRVAEAETRGYWRTPAAPGSAARSLQSAIDAFMVDCASEKGRAAAPATQAKYRTLFKRLRAFCAGRGIEQLQDISAECIREFKESWSTGARATGNNISRLRAFFHFCLQNEWLEKNPALPLRRPKNVSDVQKLPFTDEETQRILTAARTSTQHQVANFLLETLILVMRHTGLRIGDAVLLRADRIAGDELRIKMQKTGIHVTIPIEPTLLARLKRIVPRAHGYFFVFGRSTRMETVAELWRRRLARVFRLAGIQGGHPHRFRHTFAVDLLTKGMDVKLVSQLLGHSSVTITEKFYSAWVSKRQQVLSAEVRRAWSPDRPAGARSTNPNTVTQTGVSR